MPITQITPISPSINLPIKSESVNIDIAPTSRFGKEYDVARITTIIVLQEPLTTPQKFLLPQSEELWKPKMTIEDGQEIQYTLDGIDVGALETLKQEYKIKSDEFISNPAIDNRPVLQELADKIYQLSQYTTAEEVPIGTQLIKFSYTKPIKKNENEEFILQNLVPMASFSMQNGSKIHAIVAMPFEPFISLENVEATWTNPTNNSSEIVKETLLDNRTILSAYWQQDPMLTIRYRY